VRYFLVRQDLSAVHRILPQTGSVPRIHKAENGRKRTVQNVHNGKRRFRFCCHDTTSSSNSSILHRFSGLDVCLCVSGTLLKINKTRRSRRRPTSPPVPPPDELDETYVFVSAYSLHYNKNITLSTKPEVHNISHWCQWTTEPRPQVICTENLVEFGRVFFRYASGYANKRTNRQTDRSQHFAPLSAAK